MLNKTELFEDTLQALENLRRAEKSSSIPNPSIINKFNFLYSLVVDCGLEDEYYAWKQLTIKNEEFWIK